MKDLKYTVLKKYFGYDSFREGQEFLIDNILDNQDVLGIMPTGAGKSICFQIPAIMFDGITLVISPLISLMKDQVNALNQAGIRAAFINSSLSQQQIGKALQNAISGIYKIIYVAPERLLSYDFLQFAQNTKISMVTIDEAHCISHWGQDFRQSYLKITEFISLLPKKPVISAFTATATHEVKDDIILQLNIKAPKVLVTGFDRKNLFFSIQKPTDKFKALKDFLETKKDKSGIIYCSTRKTVTEVWEKLNETGFLATRYHAGLTLTERKENQDKFIFDEVPLIVSTNAFGMGIDKSNVSFVVHYNMPKDVESYYQEAGRAGRDGEPADCLLLFRKNDIQIITTLINVKQGEYEDEETEEFIKQKERKRLQEMTFYCYTNDCLRGYILKYFGDKAPKTCGNCSNCLINYEEKDITVEAQKILSCVKRCGEKFGVNTIVAALKGNTDEKTAKYGLENLSTFGIMKDDKINRINDIINYLILNEYLILTTNDAYPVLKLNEKAHKILFEKKQIIAKLRKEEDISEVSVKKRPKPYAGVKAVNPKLMERLKAIRLEISKDEGVPAFVIFSDATLADMCVKQPVNDEEFLNVSGVGEFKLNKYGSKFIEVIKDFTSSPKDESWESDTVLKEIKDSDDLEEFLKYIEEIKIKLEEPFPINAFIGFLNAEIRQKFNIKLNTNKITDWLLENGFLKAIKGENNKQKRVPTNKGQEIGISLNKLDNSQFEQNFYNKNAQGFVIDSLAKIFNFIID